MLSSSDYDAAIVGAGPAGSAASILLARAGLSVLLIEKAKFPRHKLCGEFISPECSSHFEQLGVASDISHKGGSRLTQTVFYSRSGLPAAVPTSWLGTGRSAIGLSRAALDQILVERAKNVGVEVLQESQAVGLCFEGGKICGIKVRAGGSTIERTARVVIDATGRSRALARFLDNAAEKKSPRARYIAFKTHLEGVDIPPGACEIYAYRGGYGGCSEVEGGVHNFCYIISSAIARSYGSDAQQLMKKVVCTNRRAAAALADARPVLDWLAVPITRYGETSLAPANGLLTVGDAASFIDPFTGSGILLALESARIVSDVVVGHEPGRDFKDLASEYEAKYRAAMSNRMHISSMLRRAAFVPFLGGALVRTLSASDRLTQRIARATRGSAV